MIDTTREETDTLARAVRWVPKGTDADGKPRKVCASTVWRWAERGVSGVRLETIFVGAVRHTSREAVQRFFERVTLARSGGPTGTAPAPQQPATRTESRRQEASEKAARELEAMGPAKGRRKRRAAAATK